MHVETPQSEDSFWTEPEAREECHHGGIGEVRTGYFVNPYFKGLDRINVTYLSQCRSTHSDVMTTVTSIPGKGELEDVPVKSGLLKKGGKFQKSVVPISLSMPATKLNRELAIERKIFFEDLERERVYRRRVEDGASAMIQSVVRGFLTRQRIRRKGKNANQSMNSCKFPSAVSTFFFNERTSSKVKKYLIQLQRHTEKIAGELGSANLVNKKRRDFLDGVPKQKLFRVVLRLQCFIRRFLARRTVQVLMRYHIEEARRMAAIKIQAMYRAFLSRRYQVQAGNKILSDAAIRIQCLVRRALDIRFVRHVRIELRKATQEDGAAVRIQNVLRGKIAKKKMIKERMDKATLVVQSSYRGYQARLTMVQKKKERSFSAVKMQSAFRGHLSRKSYKALQALDQHNKDQAALKIQCIFRGNAGRKASTVKKNDKAATTIQKKSRQLQAKKKAKSAREEKRKGRAATRIQSKFRQRKASKEVEAMRFQKELNVAAIKIQNAQRSKLARKERKRRQSDKQASAATKLQSLQRGRKGRKKASAKRQDSAANKIQQSFRSRKASLKTNEERIELHLALLATSDELILAMLQSQRVRRAVSDI